MSPADETKAILEQLGVDGAAGNLVSCSPIDGQPIGRVAIGNPAAASERAARAFLEWRSVPAPRRGELVRLLGEELRAAKEPLARLVTLESGKIVQEALGPVLVISAFNFPVAVWAWNAALALVCGNPVIWKPSEKTPLSAAATMGLAARALQRFGDAPDGLLQLVQGGREIGEALVDDPRIALVSATGSTVMGRAVGPRVASRFGRVLLELGGNNAMIVTSSADLDLASRAILFSAAGTAGQRCTTLRRLIVHESLSESLVERLRALFARAASGDPR
jgi:aldehyde dehydrogenase (NAD+)